MTHDISAVIFDMDGLLLDTERVYFQAYSAARKSFGMPESDEAFAELVGLSPLSSAAILDRQLAGWVDRAVFEREWDRCISNSMTDVIPTKPGVLPLLDHLHASNVPIAIATSTKTEKAWAHLARAGIGDRFDLIVGGDQVDRGKPAPDIYLKASSALGYDPRQCAAFEDSENGTRAAVAAGLCTVQVPDIVQPSAELRTLGHHVAADLISGARHLGLMP